MIGPCVKWAGGKRRMSHFIQKFAPGRIDRYIEPFLGSGAVFFYLAQTKPKFKTILSDSNEELINLYKCVRDNVADLIDILKQHERNYYDEPEGYYYHIRDSISPTNKIEKAAKLLFLNKTCYNGLYRVNKSGLFNVPHGTYKRPTICNSSNLKKLSVLLNLSDAEIICEDYMNITSQCVRSDFIYFDPPYWPLSKTSSFKHYTKKDFGFNQQVELYSEFERLSSIQCTVVLSNSNSPFILELYKNYKILTIITTRFINRNAYDRKNHSELIITNKGLIDTCITTAYAEGMH
jgi:DNA adenine methylase